MGGLVSFRQGRLVRGTRGGKKKPERAFDVIVLRRSVLC